MKEEYNIIKKKFQHVIFEGTNYEVGKQQANLIKDNIEIIKWITCEKIDPKKLGFENFDSLQNYFEELCPGLTDEIKGFADGLGTTPDKLVLYSPPIYNPGNCSQMSILSKITANKHVYVGRSYEYNEVMNDFRLCTLKIKDKVKHMGFTDFLLYRDDGMNDHGFCVTFTGGGTFKRKAKNKGFGFFLIVRSLLENCRTVKEAVSYLEKISINDYWNFLVTDKDSNAALIQTFDGEVACKIISNDSNENFIYSGNHYLLPEMVKYQEFAGNEKTDWILHNSKKRCDLIQNTLSNKVPEITKETIRDLLSKEIYDGLCGHYYKDYFGTLFSIIFDLSDLTADVCFGAPTHNPWQKPFTFDIPNGITEYDAIFPNKSIKLDEIK